MSRSIIYLGLDVHKDSITIAVLPEGAPAPGRVERLPNDLAKLRRLCERLAAQGDLRACYEASGAGYVLHRALREWGYPCDVIAPSLIPTKPGQQRKHDKHDATQLVRRYRAGELTLVRIPSEAEERVRDLVPCRETLQREAALNPGMGMVYGMVEALARATRSIQRASTARGARDTGAYRIGSPERSVGMVT